jgi:sugar/nucleoside kinase (ribokinase family)
MRAAQAAGARIILDPAPAPKRSRIREIDPLLRLTDIVTPNESEAEALTGFSISNCESALQAAQALYARGVKTVVIMLGAKGLVYLLWKCSLGTLPSKQLVSIERQCQRNESLAEAVS